jgi:hypothetical protein
VGEPVVENAAGEEPAGDLCDSADTDRTFGVPGAEPAGSHAATEFVAWYDGHPDCAAASFELTQQTAAAMTECNPARNPDGLREWAALQCVAGGAQRQRARTGMRIVRNRRDPDGWGGVRAVATDKTTELPVGHVSRSVGYKGRGCSPMRPQGTSPASL